MRRWIARGALACAVIMATELVAQSRPAPLALSTPRTTAAVGIDSTPSAWRFEQCMGGLTYGAPLKWAMSYGMGFVSEHPESDWCVLAAAKLGLGGAGLHLGMANAFAPFGSGVALTVGAIRTFDQPLNALARRTYVGASLHAWPILAVGGEFGWYTRIGKDAAGSATPRSLLVWSTGFGF
jgi:hypothetical protein